MFGMSKCNKPCQACPFIKEGNVIKYGRNKKWQILVKANCETENIIYMIECEKCDERYIGESKRSIAERFSEHKGYVNKIFPKEATGVHFNLPGHKVSDMKITILQKLYTENTEYRKEKEKYLINKFNTFYKGINREK